MGPVSDWSDFGLLGLVIFACFFLIHFMIKAGLDKFENMTNKYSEDFGMLRKEHQFERAQWLKSEENRSEKQQVRDEALTKSLVELTHAIQLQNDRYRSTDIQQHQGS